MKTTQKEWKGNSRSAQAALAINKKNTTSEREADDFYATDPKALEALIKSKYLTNKTTCRVLQRSLYNCLHGDNFIWECAAGTGNLSDWLYKEKFNFVASDLKFRRGCAEYIIQGLDFLKTKPQEKFKGNAGNPIIILTNPPYSLASEFILHALDVLPNGGFYIALMNLQYLAGKKRYEEIYSNGCLRYVYVFSKRINCYKNGDENSIKHSSCCNYAWYVFQKGYNGDCKLYWL